MSNIFICGDHHYSHKNCIKFDGRPFSSVEEMDETMIERHNEVVEKSDIVYSVGDFCFGGTEKWKSIRKRMNGDWHLVKGNHDKQSYKFLRELFSTVQEIKNLRVGKQTIVLSHYPMYTWEKSHYGSFSVHGHEHGSLKDTYDQTGKILDVGVMANNYYPYHVDEIIEHMKTKPDNWNQLDNRRCK